MSRRIIGLLLLLVGLVVAFTIFNRPGKIPSSEDSPKSSEIVTKVRVDHRSQAQVPKTDPGNESVPSSTDEGAKPEAAPVDFDAAKQAETTKLTTVAQEFAVDKKTRVQIDCGDFYCNYLFLDLKTDHSDQILEYLKEKGSFYLSTLKSFHVSQDTNGMRLRVEFYRDSLEKDEKNISEDDRLSEVKKQMDEVKTKSPNLDSLGTAEYLKAYLKLFIDQSVADSSLSDIEDYSVDCGSDLCVLNISFKSGTPLRNVNEHRDFVFLFIKQIAVTEKVKEYSMSSSETSAKFEIKLKK